MSQTIKVIKNLKVALKDFEFMVKNPENLWNKKIQNFSLRAREAWGNWLICAVLEYVKNSPYTFAEDNEGDGFLIDKTTGRSKQTEHVSALEIPKGKKLAIGEQRVIDAINLKIDKGFDYAKDKILVVFFDGAGVFYRNKIRENIEGRHGFDSVFCIGLLESGPSGYEYIVTEFNNHYKNTSFSHRIRINPNFESWLIIPQIG